jgi:hypothetical protein
MRPEEEYQKGLELIKAGINDCEIGRRLGSRGARSAIGELG